MKIHLKVILIILFVEITTKPFNCNTIKEDDAELTIHSRKKRFLIFPEGSSLQLVYCLTIPTIGMGNIFTIGWTAALAWELPHEPFYPFRRKGDTIQRIDKFGSQTSGGWTVQKQSISTSNNSKLKTKFSLPYSTIKDYLIRSGYTNIDNKYRDPSKRKYDDYRPIYDASTFSSSRKSNNAMKESASFYSDPVYKQIHRKTRRDLFTKLEKFLDAQRQDGKACLLKAICEVSKTSYNEVGTFMEEIIKAIFKVKPYKHDTVQDEYDLAADENHNCTEKYSRCGSSVWALL